MRADRSFTVGWIHAAVAAFQFLTRLPVPVRIDYSDRVFRRSTVFYPLVGAVLGLLLVGTAKLLLLFLPVLPTAALCVSVWVALSGALHLDGLMDTADGVLSHRSRERMLEIMKDSRVGAMGVIVCVLYLLLKFTLVYTLLSAPWNPIAGLFLLVPVWSRWFMSFAIVHWPYARQEQGLGSLFAGSGYRYPLIGAGLAVALTVVVLLAAVGFSLSTPSVWLDYVLLPLASLIAGYGLAAYLQRKLGGLTGDAYGAINEWIEMFLLLVLVIRFAS